MICTDYWSCLSARLDDLAIGWYQHGLCFLALALVFGLWLMINIQRAEPTRSAGHNQHAEFLRWTQYALFVCFLLLLPSALLRLFPQWLFGTVVKGPVGEVQRLPLEVFIEVVKVTQVTMIAGFFATALPLTAMLSHEASRGILLKMPMSRQRPILFDDWSEGTTPGPHTPDRTHRKDPTELTPFKPNVESIGIITPPPGLDDGSSGGITPPPPLPLPFVAWLELLYPSPSAGQARTWRLKGKVTLGHDPNQCNLLLPRTEALSRLHARIELGADKCALVNKNRYGNTRVDGRQIKEGEEALLSHDARIELDKVQLRFGRMGLPVLQVHSGNLKGQRISGKEPPISIGKAGDIEIPSANVRAVIDFDPGEGTYCIEQEGKGEIKVDGTVLSQERRVLRPGNILELGNNTIEFGIGHLEE